MILYGMSTQYMTSKYERKPKPFFWQAMSMGTAKTISDDETNIDK